MKEKKTDKTDKKAEKINSLFNRTSDEIFYDFFKKNSKIIFLCLLISTAGVFYKTYQYQTEIAYEERITKKIMKLSDLKESEKNNYIETIIKEEKKLKENHLVLLLLSREILEKKDFLDFYKKVKNIKYLCQYPFTTYHFDSFSLSAELLYFKTLYLLGEYGEIEEMKHFFMEKKIQTSVFSFYAHFLLAIYTKDKNIFQEMFVGYGSFITNLPKEILYYIQLGENK